MDIFIASDRQLPIRYYVNEAIWIRRGCLYPPQLTLPFFVEIEIKNSFHLQTIINYIQDFQRQYKHTEIQILVRDINVLIEMQEILPTTLSPNHLITIQQL